MGPAWRGLRRFAAPVFRALSLSPVLADCGEVPETASLLCCLASAARDREGREPGLQVKGLGASAGEAAPALGVATGFASGCCTSARVAAGCSATLGPRGASGASTGSGSASGTGFSAAWAGFIVRTCAGGRGRLLELAAATAAAGSNFTSSGWAGCWPSDSMTIVLDGCLSLDGCCRTGCCCAALAFWAREMPAAEPLAKFDSADECSTKLLDSSSSSSPKKHRKNDGDCDRLDSDRRCTVTPSLEPSRLLKKALGDNDRDQEPVFGGMLRPGNTSDMMQAS